MAVTHADQIKEETNAYVKNFFLYYRSCPGLNPASSVQEIPSRFVSEVASCMGVLVIGSLVFFEINL